MNFKIKSIYTLIILSFFTLYSCLSEDKESHKKEEIIDVPISLKNEKQTHLLSNLKDTTITLSGGLNVFIPSQAFVDKNGVIIDSVEVQFTECLTMEAMLNENLTTTSDSVLLISNGMLKIDVYQDKETLSLAERKELKVYFPKHKNTNDYQLFYGETSSPDSAINWVLDSKQKEVALPNKITKKYINKIWYSGYIVKVEDFVPTYKFKDANLKVNVFDYFRNKFKPSKLALKWLSDNHKLEESSTIDGLDITIKYNKDFTVKDILYSNKNSLFAAELDAFIRNMPKIDYGTFRESYFKNPQLQFNVYAKTELDKKDYEKQVEANMKKFGVKSLSKRDLDYFVYSISKLGWINCDRFYEYSDRMNLYVSKQDSEDLQFNLIFKDFKSILHPTKKNKELVFKGIPENEPVQLIGYQILGDSVLYSSNNFTTKQKIIQINEAEIISFVDFKNRLRMLNN